MKASILKKDNYLIITTYMKTKSNMKTSTITEQLQYNLLKTFMKKRQTKGDVVFINQVIYLLVI